jgi:SOS-response transcriptional repressor LexA
MDKKNSSSSDISKRLREFAEYSSITQRELGEALYVSANQISNIFNNRSNLTNTQIDILKYKFNLNQKWLRYGDAPMLIEKSTNEFPIVPILSDIPAEPSEYCYDSYTPSVGDEYIPAIGVKGINLFAIRVKDDSMEPTLHNDDILIIDPRKKFKYGIAVVRYSKGYKIRNVRLKNNSIYHIWPQNTTYKDEEIFLDKETRLFVPIKVITIRDI